MLARLRGHHLICLQFYRGEGYDEKFVKNLEAVLSRVEKEGALIVEGADDICSACPYLVDGKCRYSEGSDEEIKYLDVLALNLLDLSPESIVKWKDVKKRIENLGVLEIWMKEACSNCDWRKVCHIEYL